MLREKSAARGTGARSAFNWREGEITRFEGFSDAVFAITPLIVSLKARHTFTALLAAMRGFGVSAACFTLLVLAWHRQYLFSQRCGLHDAPTLAQGLIFLGTYWGWDELQPSSLKQFDVLNAAGDPRHSSWAGLLYPITLLPLLTGYHWIHGPRHRSGEVLPHGSPVLA